MAGKKRKTIKRRVKKAGFPTIADLAGTVPKGGLLDPSLRRGVTGKIPTAKDIFGK